MWKQIKPVDERETTRIANVWSQNWCSKAFYILFTFLFNFSLFVALLHQMRCFKRYLKHGVSRSKIEDMISIAKKMQIKC